MPDFSDYKAVKDRRKWSKDGLPAKRIPDALAAHDRIAAVSCEIRKRAGLEPLEESHIVAGWRARRPKRRVVSRPKRSAKVPASDPSPTSTPTAEIGRIELTPAIAFRLSGAELRGLASGNGPSEIAMIEIQRRKDLRREKVAA